MNRALQFALFFGISTLIFGSLHYYLWARLVRDPALPPAWARAATVALVALLVSIPGTFMLARLLDLRLSALAWVAYVWMGLFFLLLVSVFATDVVRVAIQLGAWITGGPLDPERRQLLARTLAGVATAVGAGTGAVAAAGALGPVRVKEVEVPLAKLPKALDGFSIVAISDVHLGPTIGEGFMRDVVRRINALRPSIVAVVGDLVDGAVEELEAAARPLAELEATHGKFFVTGNHEYYSGVESWMAFLPKLGLKVLGNERVQVGDGAESFELAGTHDWQGRSFGPGLGHDLDRALHGRDPERALVLLAHQPRVFPEAAEKGVDLQISGHTHGGQIWPFGFIVRLQQGFLAGLSKRGGSHLYVSRGTGYWGPPMRLGAPAEITRIVLRAA